MPGRVLVVEDNRKTRESIERYHRDAGWETSAVATSAEALEELRREFFDLVYLDIVRPDRDGVDAFGEIRQLRPGQLIVVLARKRDFRRATEIIERGAFHFLDPRSTPEQFVAISNLALTFARLQNVERELEHRGTAPTEYLGESQSSREIRTLIRDIAAHDSRVLIVGESGAGKEIIARNIHRVSNRRERPFVKVNCAGVSDEQIESVLFGSAQPTATRGQSKFHEAAGGILYLAEVDELGRRGQARLLRAFQEGTSDLADARVIASTTRHLGEEVAVGRFREDLYHELNGVLVNCPPLNERVEDIVPLTRAFIAEFCSRMSISNKSLDAEVIDRLTRYPWPGNVRELRNQVERMVFMCPSRVIQLEDLSAEIRAGVPSSLMTRRGERVIPEPVPAVAASPAPAPQADEPVRSYVGLPIQEARRRFERDLIMQALAVNAGNVGHAADELDIQESTLRRKMKSLGIDND